MFLLNNLLLIDIPSDFHKLNIILTHFSFFLYIYFWVQCPMKTVPQNYLSIQMFPQTPSKTYI